LKREKRRAESEQKVSKEREREGEKRTSGRGKEKLNLSGHCNCIFNMWLILLTNRTRVILS